MEQEIIKLIMDAEIRIREHQQQITDEYADLKDAIEKAIRFHKMNQ